MDKLEEFLQHHGIKGMKWGVRRFQPYPKGQGNKGKYTGPKGNTYKELNRKEKRAARKIHKTLHKRQMKDVVETREKFNKVYEKEIDKQGLRSKVDMYREKGTEPPKGVDVEKWKKDLKETYDKLHDIRVKAAGDVVTEYNLTLLKDAKVSEAMGRQIIPKTGLGYTIVEYDNNFIKGILYSDDL